MIPDTRFRCPRDCLHSHFRRPSLYAGYRTAAAAVWFFGEKRLCDTCMDTGPGRELRRLNQDYHRLE